MIRKRNIRVLVGVVAGLLALGLVLLRFLPAMGVAKHINELRAAGVPTSPLELDRWYKRVPPEDNAALAVAEAVGQIRSAPPDEDPYAGKFLIPPAGRPLPQDLQRAIEKRVTNHHAVLAMLHAAVPLPESRYPIDLSVGANVSLTSLAQLKAGAQLLKLEAIHAASTGDSQRATQAVITGLALSGSLREEPLLISQLVRFACLAITLDSLERVVAVCALSDAQLGRLMDALLETEDDGAESLYKSMVGERAIGMQTFSMTVAQLANWGGMGAPPAANSFKSIMMEVASGAQRAVGLRIRDQSMYLELMNDLIKASAEPFPERSKRLKATEDRMTEKLSSKWAILTPISRMVIPALAKAGVKDGISTGRIRCARAALGVERFRLRNGGGLPETLGGLVPEFIASIPEDPFDGQPVRIESLPGKGYCIRSVTASQHVPNLSRDKDRPRGLVFVVNR